MRMPMKYVAMFLMGLAAAGARSPVDAKVVIPQIFANNMVLQEHKAIPVWGWTSHAGTNVMMVFAGKTRTAKANRYGRWMVKFPPMVAGGPWTMSIHPEKEASIDFKNVLVGEVWLCAGGGIMQSSLWRGVEKGTQPTGLGHLADHPDIRLARVFAQNRALPVGYRTVLWKVCRAKIFTSHYAGGYWRSFSAIAYHFAVDLHARLHVPIGIIEDVNATGCYAPLSFWVPLKGLASVPACAWRFARLRQQQRQLRWRASRDIDEFLQNRRVFARAFAAGRRLPVILPDLTPRLNDLDYQWSSIYNAQICPIQPFAIRGVIWSEPNYTSARGKHIGGGLMNVTHALINGWRAAWGQGNLPFCVLQASPFEMMGQGLRVAVAANAQVAMHRQMLHGHTGMVVINDLPVAAKTKVPNRQTIARRFALWAQAKVYYRHGVVYSGPLFKSMRITAGAIRVQFSHLDGGLCSRGSNAQAVTGFEVAGARGKFVRAHAIIDHNAVLVTSAMVAHPTQVRYGWNLRVPPGSLVNRAGLPASVFNTRQLSALKESASAKGRSGR